MKTATNVAPCDTTPAPGSLIPGLTQRPNPLAQLAEECRRGDEHEAVSSILARVEVFEQDLRRNLPRHSTSDASDQEASAASDQAEGSAGSESNDDCDDSIVQRYFTGHCKIVGRTLRSRYAARCQ